MFDTIRPQNVDYRVRQNLMMGEQHVRHIAPVGQFIRKDFNDPRQRGSACEGSQAGKRRRTQDPLP